MIAEAYDFGCLLWEYVVCLSFHEVCLEAVT